MEFAWLIYYSVSKAINRIPGSVDVEPFFCYDSVADNDNGNVTGGLSA